MRTVVAAALTVASLSCSAAGQQVFPSQPHAVWFGPPFSLGSGLVGPLITHQVIRADLFGPTPIQITGIAFAPANFPGTVQRIQRLQSLSIRLGYTSKNPGAVGAAGLAVPSPNGGGAPNALYGGTHEFFSQQNYELDVIAGGPESFAEMGFTGAWTFNPTLGNLLLEISVVATDPYLGLPVSGAFTGGSESSFAFLGASWPNGFYHANYAPRVQFTFSATGACCIPSVGCQAGLTEVQCAAAGGTFRGLGSSCSPPCITTGACCLPSGACAIVEESQCTILEGVFRGIGSSCADPCPTRATLINIGVLPGAATSDGRSVNGSGTVVVGESGARAFRWARDQFRPTGLMEDLGPGVANAVSADGSIVVGTSGGAAARWAGAFPSPLAGGSGSFAAGVDSTGGTVVGSFIPPQGACDRTAIYCQVMTQFQCASAGGIYRGDGSTCQTCCSAYSPPYEFRAPVPSVLRICTWDVGGAVQELPLQWFGWPWRATGIDGSGRVVVGNHLGYGGFAYVLGGGATFLPPLVGASTRWVNAVSKNGLVAVGESGSRAVRWTIGGETLDLGVLPGGNRSAALAANADGTVVTGYSGRTYGNSANEYLVPFLWTRELGMVDLWMYLYGNGADVLAWTGGQGKGLSDSGRALVGTAAYQGETRAFLAVLPLNTQQPGNSDSDGDGLLDDWEKNGIPYPTPEGPNRYELPGADPLHKDLYVEVDMMSGFQLSEESLTLLRNSFSSSPLRNPDGTNGIRLHVQRDEVLAHIPEWLTPQGSCWPLGFDRQRFGADGERGDVDRLAAKAKAYRYCIIADRSTDGTVGANRPERFGGCGRVGGDEFVVFFGSLASHSDRAAAFMHELGHNLGLLHGGGDDVNGKPNYPSIMNYAIAFRQYWNAPFWRMDFSRAGPEDGMRDLDEAMLDETAGIGVPRGYYQNTFMPFGVDRYLNGAPYRSLALARLNGTPTDFGDPAGTGLADGAFSVGVRQDLNFTVEPPVGIRLPTQPSPREVLRGFNDWSAVRLKLHAARGAGLAAPLPPEGELTIGAKEWIEQVYPIAPVCAADFDGNGAIDVRDILGFQQAFLARDILADFDLNAVVDAADVATFHQAYAAGCP